MRNPAWIPATGDVVAGDEIRYTETVWGGSYRKPIYCGDRFVRGEVLRESYGAAKQQHTFTILVRESSGVSALEPGAKIRRKGRNVYRGKPSRLQWADESDRLAGADEKHARGGAARADRDRRREWQAVDEGWA